MAAPGTSDDVVLAALPSLPGLYGKALAASSRRWLGRRRPTTELPAARHRIGGVGVDLAALTRWQQLIGAAGRDQVPSAYVHTLGFPVAMSVLARSDFPLPLLGMVHLSNEVHQARIISVSEVLDIAAWSEDLRPHHAGTQVDIVTEVRVADELVWAGRSVYLARGVRPESAGSDGKRAGAPARDDRPPFEAPDPTGAWRLAADIGRRYAEVSGDWNPIHLSGPAAKALGMKSLIAHGMYLAARMVDQAVPAPQGAVHWRIDFAAPVLLPGTVATSFSGTRSGGGTRVDVVGWSAKRQRPHFTGWVHAE